MFYCVLCCTRVSARWILDVPYVYNIISKEEKTIYQYKTTINTDI
jgi:hypothetical protein